AVRGDVGKPLDEGVLHSFVGFGGVAQVLIRDAGGAALMDGDELAEAVARLVHLAALDQRADLDRQPRVLGDRRRDGTERRRRDTLPGTPEGTQTRDGS